jgi:hypothetical protein
MNEGQLRNFWSGDRFRTDESTLDKLAPTTVRHSSAHSGGLIMSFLGRKSSNG